MPLVGCTQMDADMSGLLQRMLAKLDDTHLAACIAHSTFGLTPPPHEAAVAKCDFLNQNTQSMHFDTFQHSGKIISGGCTKSYRVHGALLLGCIGVGCSPMPLVGCTQMNANMTELLQRRLPKLDDTHLAVCIAVSTSYSKQHRRIETTAKHPPPNVPKDIDGDGRKEKHEHHQRHVQDDACRCQ